MKNQTKLGGLMALLLFAIFAVCILAVLLMGANTYEALVSRGSESYSSRTAAQYIATKVRQADSMNDVRIVNINGLDALILSEEIDGTKYETTIYYADGYIRELFAEAGYDFAPDSGCEIMKAVGLRLSECGMMGRSIEIGIQPQDGVWETFTLHLRSGEVLSP